MKCHSFGTYSSCNQALKKYMTVNCWQRGHYVTRAILSKDDIKLGLEDKKKHVTVDWHDGTNSRFHSVWLRHNCHCSECMQDYSGQRLLDGSKISPKILIEKIYINESGCSLNIKWEGSDHLGVIPLEFLKKNCYTNRKCQEHKESKHGTHRKTIPELVYKDVINSRSGILRWIKHINTEGLCLLKHVPIEEGMVGKVAACIAPLQETIYGTIFDVVNTANPINVAYSNAQLDFHMDLVYYESPPGLQFLHCLKFDSCVTGGESTFLDVFKVAGEFRKEHPKDFDILTSVPATFKKIHYNREEPVHMTYQRPHIMLNHEKKITNVNWAPAFEGPLSVSESDVEPYYEAYYKFFKAIRSSPHIIEVKLHEGDLVAFNNRMILHGRNSFDLNGGARHFQGCYVNIDAYKSKIHVLAKQLGDKTSVKHVGNQCWNTN